METALVLLVPEADEFVSPWRSKFDPSAQEGMPAHVTLLFPFKPFESIGPDDVALLSSLFRNVRAFDLNFSRVGRFPHFVWLAPEPAALVTELTSALANAFPEYPPYGGAHAVVTPHLTIAEASGEEQDVIAEEIAAKLKTPIRARITACSLFSLSAGMWREERRFVFAASRID